MFGQEVVGKVILTIFEVMRNAGEKCGDTDRLREREREMRKRG